MSSPPRQRKLRLPPPRLIGWREWVTLPELGLGPLKAKADTGARSAALHAEHIEIYSRSGVRRVRFDAFLDEARHITTRCDVVLHGVKRVRSTSGATEERWVIETDIQLGPYRWPALVTLTNRTDMGLPMLLGRATVRGRFVVDPSRSFLIELGQPPETEAWRTTEPGQTGSSGEEE
jgi:hypothetical protein